MFVNHKPYMVYDIEKNENVCVCGKEADSQEYGYCEECLEKRNEFIEGIVGDISLDSELEDMLIEPFETLRKRVIRDRVGFILDNYLNDIGSEPYTDIDLTIRCLHDKTDLLADMVRDLEQYTFTQDNGFVGTKRRFISTVYSKYLKRLSSMYVRDWDLIKRLNSYKEQTPQEQVNKLVLETQKGLN